MELFKYDIRKYSRNYALIKECVEVGTKMNLHKTTT